MLSALIAEVEQKKAQLDRLRPLSPSALGGLEHAYDLELTYTSNAIEGNTLTQIETALVIEHGVTIGGKKLKDHLEAIDHYDAIRYVREIADHTEPLTESDVRNLHALVMRRSDPEIAGSYATSARYVITDKGRHAFPAPTEVPALMGDFAAWLRAAPRGAGDGILGASPAGGYSSVQRRQRPDGAIADEFDSHPRAAFRRSQFVQKTASPISRPCGESQARRGHEAFDRLLYERLDAT